MGLSQIVSASICEGCAFVMVYGAIFRVPQVRIRVLFEEAHLRPPKITVGLSYIFSTAITRTFLSSDELFEDRDHWILGRHFSGARDIRLSLGHDTSCRVVSRGPSHGFVHGTRKNACLNAIFCPSVCFLTALLLFHSDCIQIDISIGTDSF
jgi:hypothetical protein